MQAFDATLDEISFDRGRAPSKALPPILLASAALALVGSLGAFVLHGLAGHPLAPAVAAARSTPSAAAKPFGDIIVDSSFVAKHDPAAPEISAKPFGDIIIDPSFVAEMKHAFPADSSSPLASLEAVPPPPEAAPPALSRQAASPALPEAVPLPPKRDVPEIVDSAPLPPPRPAEFASLGPTNRHQSEQSAAPASTDNRNIFQRFFGFALPSGSAGKSPGNAPYRTASLPTAPAPSPLASIVSAPSGAPEGRGRGLFGGYAPATERLGYDRYTAVYDISARTVYLPDGTRLEAHSGYGDRLDNPRYVSERMYGPTPPNVYELTPREASFHGVDALRLNPVGDEPLYGRAGLLAHPYMLGPNGDSNGCVSFKDYNAFLRAYRNGQVKRLAVVARI